MFNQLLFFEFVQFIDLIDQKETDDEEYHQKQDPVTRRMSKVCRNKHQDWTEKIGELPKDIKKTEIFVGFFLWYDFPEIGAADRLNPALSQADDDCQHPEFPGV